MFTRDEMQAKDGSAGRVFLKVFDCACVGRVCGPGSWHLPFTNHFWFWVCHFKRLAWDTWKWIHMRESLSSWSVMCFLWVCLWLGSLSRANLIDIIFKSNDVSHICGCHLACLISSGTLELYLTVCPGKTHETNSTQSYMNSIHMFRHHESCSLWWRKNTRYVQDHCSKILLWSCNAQLLRENKKRIPRQNKKHIPTSSLWHS